MAQELAHIAVLVADYDEAIAFYCDTLGFTLVEDTAQPEQNKRWVVVRPAGSRGSTVLLARASNEKQQRFVGNQAGGRVFLFLATDDFDRDHRAYQAAGVRFIR
ncbi:MAG: VOC family protein, partial [Pseudomonadota bacterium]